MLKPLIVALLIPTGAWAAEMPAPAPQAVVAELQRTLDARLRHPGQPKPPGLTERMAAVPLMGLSMAVMHKGRVHWAQGFGEARAGVPVTAETRFQAGSISKPVAALGAMALAQQRGIGFDDDLRPLIQTWQAAPEPAPAPGAPLRYTLRHLLSHSAGLSQHGFPGYGVGAPLPTLPQILDGMAPANTQPVRPLQPAGQGWRYSGGGGTIVQLWVQEATGLPYPQALQQLALQPLGMVNSHFGPPASPSDPRYAQSHQGRTPEPGGWRIYPEMAAAGLWTTPTDIAQMLLAVQRAGQGQASPVAPAVAQAATQPVIAPSSMGFFVSGEAADPRFGHNGSNQGFESYAFSFVQRGEGVVLMANGQNSWALVDAAVRTLARLYGWPGMAAPEALAQAQLPRAAAAWAGVYAPPEGPALRVRWHRNALWLDEGPGSWQRLWPTTDGRFATDAGLSGVRLDAAGLQLAGSSTVLVRQPLAPGAVPQPYLRGSFNGWQATQALTPAGAGLWRSDFALAAGPVEFKIGDADWAALNLGAGPAPDVGLGAWTPLAARGGNLKLAVPQQGRYRLELRLRDGPAPAQFRLTRLGA